MPRYIDLDKVIEKLDNDLKTGDEKMSISWLRSWLNIQDTADVVPRSEVEELIYKLECLLCHATASRLSKHTYDLRTMETVVTDYVNETYNDGYGEGHKDCAREIFEEIEEDCLDFPMYDTDIQIILDKGRYDAIKKKHIGDQK